MPTLAFRTRQWTTETVLKITLSVAMASYSFWLTSNRAWGPDRSAWKENFAGSFFTNQAMSMFKGRLDVSGPTYLQDGECLYRAGKCFGYFGIFPSIVRMPFILLFDSTTIPLTSISVGLAAGLTMWASLEIASYVLDIQSGRKFDQANRQLILLSLGVLLGPASSLVMLSQAKVYREAIIWMVALTMLALAMTLRWIATDDNKFLVIALVTSIAATNSRPNAIPTSICLGLWLMYHLYRRQNLSIEKTSTRLALAILIVPTAVALLIFYLKVRMIYPSNTLRAGYPDRNMKIILDLNEGKEVGSRFALTNLVQYFRPDSVRYALGRPWAHVLVPGERAPIFVRPIVPGGMYFEPTASITNTMPIQLVLSAVVVISSLWRKRLGKYFHLRTSIPLMAIALTTTAASLAMWANTSRYVGDFLPFLMIGTLFGVIGISCWLNEKEWLRPALLLSLPIAFYFVLVQFALNIETWGHVG